MTKKGCGIIDATVGAGTCFSMFSIPARNLFAGWQFGGLAVFQLGLEQRRQFIPRRVNL